MEAPHVELPQTAGRPESLHHTSSILHKQHSISEMSHDAWEALHRKYHKLWHKAVDHHVEEIHPDSPFMEHAKHRFENYRRDLRVDFFKQYVLMLNFVRDFIWAYLTATGYTFIDIGADWTPGYALFHQSVYQSVCAAFGMWFILVVFLVIRHFDDHHHDVHINNMIASYFGVLLPILPWNFGVFLAANTYRGTGSFKGIFMNLGSSDANLLGSIFTGYFEGFVQMFVPWLFSVIVNEKGAREGTSHMWQSISLFGCLLFFINWTFNSVGGAIWNIVYYLGAVNMTNSNNPDIWPVQMVEFSTAGVCGSMDPCNVGVWASFTLAFAVAFSVMCCNYYCPPLMHFFVSDKKHRLHIRRWMRAARHLVDVYHHHHVVHQNSFFGRKHHHDDEEHAHENGGSHAIENKSISFDNNTESNSQL